MTVPARLQGAFAAVKRVVRQNKKRLGVALF